MNIPVCKTDNLAQVSLQRAVPPVYLVKRLDEILGVGSKKSLDYPNLVFLAAPETDAAGVLFHIGSVDVVGSVEIGNYSLPVGAQSGQKQGRGYSGTVLTLGTVI